MWRVGDGTRLGGISLHVGDNEHRICVGHIGHGLPRRTAATTMPRAPCAS
jgi:hypothetical protein